ncbi:MAG TPA: MDR family MFS transporter [Dictyobacter sp.]|jgi:EmrB/QacA subfamily drug resistance transporter|nr:MDR family MFS transporter [Dictyobacter sp.]
MMFKPKRIHLRPLSNGLKASNRESGPQRGIDVTPPVELVPASASEIVNLEGWPNQMSQVAVPMEASPVLSSEQMPLTTTDGNIRRLTTPLVLQQAHVDEGRQISSGRISSTHIKQSSLSTPPAVEVPRYSQRETLLTMLGVLLVMLLASLDQTIVSAAMPRIISDLNGYTRYTWVTTAYLLTSTVMVPIYGKLSDIFGRKVIFLFGVVIFLIGSALSGASQTMNELIAFRAFQGIGAAALIPIALAVVGDLFTPRERGRWQGITGSVFGLSSVVGPLAGGWITENASWHWIFYVNVPIGIVALLVLAFLMPPLKKDAQKVRIDYVGALLLILGTVPLLLGFTWAGTTYPWLSVQIIGTIAGSIVLLAIFVLYESRLSKRNLQPVIDPSLLKNSVFSIATLIASISFMGMYGCIFFVPLFAQSILHVSPTYSGMILTPMMLALIVGSVISGQLVARLGKYKIIALIGSAIALVGAILLLPINVHTTDVALFLPMIVFGFGVGFSMSLYTLVVQNALPQRIGEATSGLTFFRSIGATIALAAMGSIMNSSYASAFQNALPTQVRHILPAAAIAAFGNPNVLESTTAQQALQKQFSAYGTQGQQLYNTLMSSAQQGLAQGVHDVFVMAVVLMILGLLVTLILKELPLLGGPRGKKSGGEQAEQSAPMMMH